MPDLLAKRNISKKEKLTRVNGFTLVEILTVVSIIGILATMAIASMRGGKRVAFETRAIAAMKNIAENEAIYYNRFKTYGTWEQLVLQGDLIDPGYTRADDLRNPRDTPMAYLYSINILVSSGGNCFTAVAYPRERSVWHLRTYATTCDGGILNSKDHGRFFSTLPLVLP